MSNFLVIERNSQERYWRAIVIDPIALRVENIIEHRGSLTFLVNWILKESPADRIHLKDGTIVTPDSLTLAEVAELEFSVPVKERTRSRCESNGIRARVKREVFAAAVAPHSEERDEDLAYWHARQRSAERLYYGLKQYAERVPTRNQLGAEKHENRHNVGPWIGSSEYNAEQRAMGFSAL